MRAHTIATAAGFTLLTAVLFWPWLAHLSSQLIGPPEDNLQDFWNSWYVAVAADYRHFFSTTLIRFPEGTSLSYHSFAYPQVFAVAVLARLFGSSHAMLLALHNLTLLASFPLAGTGAFLLLRRFTADMLASLVGGYVFAFSPWHVQQVMHHAHVSEIGFIPFFVFAYLEAVQRKSLVWLSAAIAFYALSALSSWYYLFYLAFFLLFHTAYQAIRDRTWPRDWPLPLLCLAGTLLLLSPVLLPMMLNGGSYKGGWNTYLVDLTAFFVPAPTHLLLCDTAAYYARLPNHPWEGTAYLGLINLGLLVWLYRRDPRDPLMRYALSGLIVFAVLACGAYLHVLGHDLRLPLPAIVFGKLPFFANIRTPSRIMVLVYLFLALGVGAALSRLRREHRPLLTAAIVVLLAIDFVPVGLASTDATCPKVLDVIRNDPEPGFGVLNAPRNYVAQNEPMFQQTCHGKPVVVAQISRTLSPSLMDYVERRDLARQRDQLRRAHVKYIVLRPPGRDLAVWTPEDGAFAPYLATYPVAAKGDGFLVLQVRGMAADPAVR